MPFGINSLSEISAVSSWRGRDGWRGEQHATIADMPTDCVAGTPTAFAPVLVSTIPMPRIALRPQSRVRRALDFRSVDETSLRTTKTVDCGHRRWSRGLCCLTASPKRAIASRAGLGGIGVSGECGGPINYYMILAILVCISNALESQPNTIINVSTCAILAGCSCSCSWCSTRYI